MNQRLIASTFLECRKYMTQRTNLPLRAARGNGTTVHNETHLTQGHKTTAATSGKKRYLCYVTVV